MKPLQMYIRHLLTERLLPINEELYQKMLEWYKKQFNIWKIGKNIENLKLKIKSSKERMNSFIKENQLNDFDNFITESIYDFFDFFDGDWEVIEKGKVEKYTAKEYSKKFDNGFEFLLYLIVEPKSSVLEIHAKYEDKDKTERSQSAIKIFEFDLSERFYAFIPEDILKWFKEDGFFIHDEYEEIYYNIKDDEHDLAEDLKIAEKISEDDIETSKKFSFEEDGKTFYLLGILYTRPIVDDDLKNGANFNPAYGSVVISSEFIYKYGFSWFENALEHEIRHAMQSLDKETGKFDKIQRGLPKKKLQTKHADFDGQPKNPENAEFPMEPNDPNAKRILHNLRDVEFQTNLGSAWFDLKKELKKIEDPNIRNSIFLNAINPSSKVEIPYGMGYEAKHLKQIAQHSLNPLRNFDRKKWQAYVKMLYQLYQKEFS